MISKYAHSRKKSLGLTPRHKIFLGGLYFGLFIILSRLFYWQIIKASGLKTQANQQYQRTVVQKGERGRIFTKEKHLLVGNTKEYQLVAYPYLLTNNPEEIAKKIQPLLLNNYFPYQEASESAQKEKIAQEFELTLLEKLRQKEAKWVSLLPHLSKETKEKIAALDLVGLDFEEKMTRFYPEASMAAHLTGFVAQDESGEDKGYFGVEGALDKELKGKKRKITLDTDALGFSLFNQNQKKSPSTKGRDVVLTLRRDLQFLAETELKKGVERYGAKSGEVVIVEPQTGAILALAASPSYDPAKYYRTEPIYYKNPSLINLFEPGSIMKTLTVAAGIDQGVITPETECPRCSGPRVIDKYTIKTWNNEYHPQITMTEALAKSDNTAMIYIAEELGEEKFQEYLHKFEIGEELGVELDGDNSTPFPEKWGPVELATRSFGQGITTTSLQMTKALSAIANKGLLMKPQIISAVITPNGEEIEVKPKALHQVISPQTAEQVTKMMVYAAKSGEAQWTYSKTHSVAAKTGTSQIPSPDGGYKQDATIASFIGFAPPNDPKFVMLIKLSEPQSSPWAAETAAPLWYKIAEKLFLMMNIPPDQV